MKFLASMSIFALAVIVSIATMINGWGLEVTSWPWVIGGCIGGGVLGAVSALIGNS